MRFASGPISELPTTHPEPQLQSKNRLILHSMIELGLSNSAQRGDEYCREQWSAYYSERRRHLARMFWLAGGLGAVFLLFAAVAERHSLLANMLAVPLAILLLALPAQWAIYGWKIGGWTCPRCGEFFFASTFVRNPLGRTCRHCGLARPKKSEIGHFHYEDERSTPQVPSS